MGKKRALDRFFGNLFHRKRSLRTNRVLEQAQIPLDFLFTSDKMN
jgi:hypothetical protein